MLAGRSRRVVTRGAIGDALRSGEPPVLAGVAALASGTCAHLLSPSGCGTSLRIQYERLDKPAGKMGMSFQEIGPAIGPEPLAYSSCSSVGPHTLWRPHAWRRATYFFIKHFSIEHVPRRPSRNATCNDSSKHSVEGLLTACRERRLLRDLKRRKREDTGRAGRRSPARQSGGAISRGEVSGCQHVVIP